MEVISFASFGPILLKYLLKLLAMVTMCLSSLPSISKVSLISFFFMFLLCLVLGWVWVGSIPFLPFELFCLLLFCAVNVMIDFHLLRNRNGSLCILLCMCLILTFWCLFLDISAYKLVLFVLQEGYSSFGHVMSDFDLDPNCWCIFEVFPFFCLEYFHKVFWCFFDERFLNQSTWWKFNYVFCV